MVATDFQIDTPRLLISHLDSSQDSHCDLLVTLFNAEQNRAHKSVAAQMQNREAARKNIASNEHIQSSGYGRYLVSLKPPNNHATEETGDTPVSKRVESCTRIGTVSVKFRKFEGAPLAPDVGYALLPAFQGKGYATEAAAALVHYIQEEKGQKEFFGFCDPNNEGSKGVLRRIGFEERGVRNIVGLYSDGEIIVGMVFSKGLTKDLEAYGLR